MSPQQTPTIDPGSTDAPTHDYKVGYGRPPKTFQYKKGQSGNPRGSSRKVRERMRRANLSFDDLVLADSQKPIRLREGGRTSTVSMKEALLQKQYAMALNGNRLALKACIDRIETAEQNQLAQILEFAETALDYKDNYPSRAKLCFTRGLPPPLPHPDDVQLNSSGKLMLTGPRNHQEFAELEKLLQGRAVFAKMLDGQRSDMEEPAREGDPYGPTELKIVSDIQGYFNDFDSEFERRGWLPRVAGKLNTG